MPRSHRIQTPGLIHHVMSRGNGRMELFLDDADYRQFVYLLGDTFERSAIRCWNYCVMPNHYHATIELSRANMSRALKRLNGTYATWWNRRHGRVGHVFQGRYKDQVVDRDGYLLALSRYVVMNPVRAGLVERPAEWPWSSYRATVSASPVPSFLDVGATLRLFGESDDSTLIGKFEQFVDGQCDPALVDRIRSEASVLGSRAFVDSVLSPSDPGLTPV